MNTEWFSPHSQDWRIGSLIDISATEAKINLTYLGADKQTWTFGTRIPIGEVNTFVFIDCGQYSIFGRLIKVWLENGERLKVDQISDNSVSSHPIGLVQLLVSVDTETGKNYQGIKQYPKLGAQVYSAHPKLVATLAEGTLHHNSEDIFLPIAEVPSDSSVSISVTPEKLFSRHCAVLGSTGGGKSYTMANLLGNIKREGGKVLLLDPTGEYKDLPCKSYYVGEHPDSDDTNRVTYPHWMFADSDIRALLKPSGQSQAPKLEAAIQSLQIIKHTKNVKNDFGLSIQDNRLIIKTGNVKINFQHALISLKENSPKYPEWKFENLPEQIIQECVYPDANFGKDPDKWGGRVENEVGYCLSLISRIKAMASNQHLKWMLDCNSDLKTIPVVVDELCSATSGIVRLDLSHVPFEANARELLVNTIGRYLLTKARKQDITNDKPLIVFIDEAHQFLNKKIGDETSRFDLDAFGNIAKEGRKYGLNVVIATQRPRDIPEDVLSQIGTLIVHRLTNEKDQDIVKKAVGAIDNRSAAFLPVLGQGEALLLGVDFPFPMTVKMKLPTHLPQSTSATFSKTWKNNVPSEADLGKPT